MTGEESATNAKKTIKVTISSSAALPKSEFQIDLGEITTVKQLKDMICAQNSMEPEKIELIKKGKRLVDLKSLEESEITGDCKIYAFVKNVPSEAPSSSAARSNPSPTGSQKPASTSNQPSNSQAQNPFGAFGGMPGLGMDLNSESYAEMQQKLMQNPEMMNSIMQSPMFQNLMKNPEMMQNIMMSNPQTKALLEKNPQLNQALQDPSFMQDIMKMYSSQAASDQMNYQNDMALRQLDNSGHFSKVESMFNNINNAFDDWPDSNNLLGGSSTRHSSASFNQSSNSTSVPNPWGSNIVPSQRSPTYPPASNKIEQMNASEVKQKMTEDPRLLALIGSLWQEIEVFYGSNREAFSQYFMPLGNSVFDSWFKNLKLQSTSGGPGKVEEFLANPTVCLFCAKIAACLLKIANYHLGFYLVFFKSNNESVFSKVTSQIGKNIKAEREKLKSSKILQNVTASPAPVLPKPKASEENVNRLMEMGFTRDQAVNALEQSFDNLQRAIEVLMSQMQ